MSHAIVYSATTCVSYYFILILLLLKCILILLYTYTTATVYMLYHYYMYIYYAAPTICVSYYCILLLLCIHARSELMPLLLLCVSHITVYHCYYMSLILLYTTAIIYTHNTAAHADVGLRARRSPAFSRRRIR